MKIAKQAYNSPGFTIMCRRFRKMILHLYVVQILISSCQISSQTNLQNITSPVMSAKTFLLLENVSHSVNKSRYSHVPFYQPVTHALNHITIYYIQIRKISFIYHRLIENSDLKEIPI